MVVRQGPDGRALLEGEQVQVGGNEVYVSLCRKHFREATGDVCGRPQELLAPLTPVVVPDGMVMSDSDDRESPS